MPGIRLASCCSPSIVLVKLLVTVSNLSTFASSVIIEKVVFLMTVAHLYCNHTQKPYIQTSTIRSAIRYLKKRFIVQIKKK